MPDLNKPQTFARRPPRPPFAGFVAPPTPPPIPRESFRGLSPKAAVDRLMRLYGTRREICRATVRQKRSVVAHMLTQLGTRGLDLASIRPQDLALYRTYLADLVERRLISRNYAAHQAIQWNSTMRAVFQETCRPGEGLIMRGFKQTPRKIEHLTPEDFAGMLAAVDQKRWQNAHYRELMRTYLEVSWCAAARIGSLVHEELRIADVDVDRGVLHLRHVKNRPHHDAVLSARAVASLEAWISFLQGTKHWRGRETPLFISPRGKVMHHQAVNRFLRQLAALATLNKPVTSHVFRKSAGTIMALVNPKLAQEQLGITEKVFNAHYNQPLLEDRMAHREILPSVASAQPGPEEAIGHAYLRYQRGDIGKTNSTKLSSWHDSPY
jgi:site-specific recombinase XerD